jgi:hypothetical protein
VDDRVWEWREGGGGVSLNLESKSIEALDYHIPQCGRAHVSSKERSQIQTSSPMIYRSAPYLLPAVSCVGTRGGIQGRE